MSAPRSNHTPARTLETEFPGRAEALARVRRLDPRIEASCHDFEELVAELCRLTACGLGAARAVADIHAALDDLAADIGAALGHADGEPTSAPGALFHR